MADDIAELISHLGVAPVRVVGWSLGGSVVQSLLIRHRELVDRAVLVAAFPSYTPLQHAWLDASLALRESGASDDAKAVFGMPWAMTPRSLSDHQAAFEGLQLARSIPHPTSLEAFKAQAVAIRTYDSRADLPGITTPTLIVVGAEDILTPVAQSIEMAALIPNAGPDRTAARRPRPRHRVHGRHPARHHPVSHVEAGPSFRRRARSARRAAAGVGRGL